MLTPFFHITKNPDRTLELGVVSGFGQVSVLIDTISGDLRPTWQSGKERGNFLR